MSGYIGVQPVPQATQTRDKFVSTSGQTSFPTSGYSPLYLDVYLNGVHLVDGTDYAATNGSDVVLSTGATTGDVLEVVAYTTFALSNGSFSGTTTFDTVVVTNTVDGRDVSVDGTKLDTIPVISTSSTASFIAKGDGSSQDGYIQLNCSQNSHGIKLKSPPHSANASYTLTFPNDDGNANQVLTTNGSGVLSWATTSSTDNTKLPLAGGAMTGNITFNSGSYDNRQLGIDSQGFFVYNVADSAYDLKLSDSGYATLRNGLTASALNVTGQQSGDYLAKLTSTNTFGLKVKTTSTSDAHEQFSVFNGSNAISFKVMGGGTVHAAGINLGGSSAANRLDDYEEGNHFPQKANGGTVAYGSGTQGHYTKVGELVTYYFDMSISAASGESGSMAITLPFAANAGDSYMAFVPWIVDTSFTGSSYKANGFINGGANKMLGYKINSGNSSGYGYINNNVTGRFSGVFTYFSG